MTKINSFNPIIRITPDSSTQTPPSDLRGKLQPAQNPLAAPPGNKELKISDLSNLGSSAKSLLNNLFDNPVQSQPAASQPVSTFGGLAPANQELLKQALTKNQGNKQDVDALTRLGQSSGFGKLTAEEQKRFINWVGGTNKELSQRARTQLKQTLDDSKIDKTAPETFRKFLDDQNNLPYVVSQNVQSNEFDSRRAPYTVSVPEEVKNFDFRSGKADSQKYIIETNGKKIPVYIGENQDPKQNYNSIEEVAKGLASLPKVSLGKIVSIRVDPKQNPEDAYWAKAYKTPDFRSYMTAGADGNISVYPTKSKQPQGVLDGTFIHETGHTLSKQLFGENTDNKAGDAAKHAQGKLAWSDWKQAMKNDGISPSAYAKQSAGAGNVPDEDFSETLELYMKVKGAPQESEIRAIMPERFALLDKILK